MLPRVLALCALSATTALWCAAAGGQQAVIPPLVVEDGQGDVIGPVVGFLNLTQPIVRLVDDEVDVPVFLVVYNEQELAAAEDVTYFQLANCAGDPYHPDTPDTSNGLAKLTGYAYSVAEIDGVSDWLIRSELSAPIPNTPYESFYDEGCQNIDGSASLRPAAAVRNLGAEFPPPYDAQ